MARWETSIDINAPADVVWQVMADVAKWPTWSASILSVEEVSRGLGAVVHAKGSPKSKWTVSKWHPGHGFDWETNVRGATTVGGHWIESVGDRSRVTLSIDVKGPLVWMFKPFIGGGIRSNIATEAAGLKSESESKSRMPAGAAPTA